MKNKHIYIYIYIHAQYPPCLPPCSSTAAFVKSGFDASINTCLHCDRYIAVSGESSESFADDW